MSALAQNFFIWDNKQPYLKGKGRVSDSANETEEDSEAN